MAKRRLKAGKRLGKLRVIRRLVNKGGMATGKLYRTNLWAVASWGAAGMGVAPTSIKSLRGLAARSVLEKGGQCTTSVIAIGLPSGADPAASVRILIVKHWLELWAAADQSLREQIRRLWPKQLPRLSRPDRWLVVHGPMRACIASLYDIGWRP
eukprot:6409687-Lingulodinium_polyedra.AAC.1